MFILKENAFNGSEDDLAKLFIKKFSHKKLVFGDNYIDPEFYEQVRIPEIGRVSDLIVKCEDSRLINIEFKLGDYACLKCQVKDHLAWCDYSYACVPINCLRNFPFRFNEFLLSKGIGLIVYGNESFLEVFKAKHNTCKNGKNKELRKTVLTRLTIDKQPRKDYSTILDGSITGL